MLRFEDVSKSYPNGLKAVRNLTFSVEDGSFVVLIGPSGCGKTTTLRMINRMVEPTSGRILLDGKDIRTLDPVALRRGIGYVIQQVGLFPHMTIAENIEVVPRLLGWSDRRRMERTDELLLKVGLEPAGVRERYPTQLSGGQQQRIGVLRALAADPELIIMDEPFAALDPLMREQLQGELKRLQETFHKTIVFVTHDVEEAFRLADKIAIMRDGKLLQFDAGPAILSHPADDFVASFVGRYRMRDALLPKLVRDVMNGDPAVVTTDAKAEEALSLMGRLGVDTVLVTDQEGLLRGFVDAWHLAARDYRGRSVDEILEEDIATAEPGEAAMEAFARLDGRRHPYLAVLEGERLVGIVTRRSMAKALAEAVWGEVESR